MATATELRSTGRILALCWVAVLGITGVGCGADESAATSVAEFREQAQAICADGNAAIDELAEDFGPDGPSPEQLEAVAPKVPGLITAELDRLAALEPPADLADDHAAMIATFRAVVSSMQEQGTAFFERDDDPFAEAYAQAEDLGLDECAR